MIQYITSLMTKANRIFELSSKNVIIMIYKITDDKTNRIFELSSKMQSE